MLVETAPEHSSHTMSRITPSEALSASADGDRVPRDLTLLRQVLTGESAVDLSGFWFGERAAVDEFLRLQQFDTDNPLDVGRIRDLIHEAAEYLTDIYRYDIPAELVQPAEVHDLFLWTQTEPQERRNLACMLLKVMHIMHHLNGRELVYSASISEAELLSRLNTRVFGVIDKLRASGIEVTEFAGGKKKRSSLVTKLLAKRGTLASQIFDRLRFSIQVKSRDDLVRAVLFLSHNLVPFNYIVPEQSQNGIITLGDVARVLKIDPQRVWEEWTRGRREPLADGSAPTPPNEFSGRTYRCVNLVADIPMRLDDIMPDVTPAIAFAQTEIQLVDEETARHNDSGENAHQRYKKRQRGRVKARLEGQNGNGGSRAD